MYVRAPLPIAMELEGIAETVVVPPLINIFAFVEVPKVTLPIELTDRRLCPTFEDTVKSEPGVEDPMPTFPFARTLKRDEVANPAEVVDAMSKSAVDEPYVPCIESFANALVVPNTVFPSGSILRRSIPFVENATLDVIG